MNKSDTIKELATALAKAQGEMPALVKDSTGQVGSQKTRYASLDAVIDVIGPVFAANGLGVAQFPISCDDRVGVETIVTHSSGEWISNEFMVPAQSTAQGFGSGLSYARRYALMSVARLAAEDDDGQAASHRDAPQAARSARPEPQTAPAERWTAAELKTAMLEHGVKGQMFAPVFGLEPKELNAPRLMLEVAGWMTANPKKTLIDLMNLVISKQPFEEDLPEPTPADLTPRADTRMFEGVA